MKKLSAIITLLVYISTSSVALAGDGHSHDAAPRDKSHGHSHDDDASALDLMTKLETTVAKIRPAMAAYTDLDLHTTMEEIDHLASHIADQVPEEKQQRVAGAASNIRRIAAALHDAAHKGDKTATDSNLKKLEAMLPVLRGQL